MSWVGGTPLEGPLLTGGMSTVCSCTKGGLSTWPQSGDLGTLDFEQELSTACDSKIDAYRRVPPSAEATCQHSKTVIVQQHNGSRAKRSLAWASVQTGGPTGKQTWLTHRPLSLCVTLLIPYAVVVKLQCCAKGKQQTCNQADEL